MTYLEPAQFITLIVVLLRAVDRLTGKERQTREYIEDAGMMFDAVSEYMRARTRR